MPLGQLTGYTLFLRSWELGFFVNRRVGGPPRDGSTSGSQALPIQLNLNVRGLSPSATLAINERCTELISEGREAFRLGLGQSPFPVPEHVVESLRANAHQKAYLPVRGLSALRDAVAHYHR